MSDQETYGRFTPGAWNVIKSARLTAKTETIEFDEAKAMLYAVVRGSTS